MKRQLGYVDLPIGGLIVLAFIGLAALACLGVWVFFWLLNHVSVTLS